MVAAADAIGPDGIPDGRSRAFSIGSLALLAAFVASDMIARAQGHGLASVEAWPLGGGGRADSLLAWTSLVLGLALGWGVPGLSLALLTDRRLRGPALLGRGLALGVGYIVVSGLAHAGVTGHAPPRGVLIGLLAVPPGILLGRDLRPASGGQRDAILGWGIFATVALTVILWPKLAHEGLNGDGTEAYEIARSLESHPLPRWDLERWEGPGRFGTPAVNPFLTNAYLVRSEMAVLGRGELAARIPFVPAVVLAVVIAGGLAGAPGRWGWTYLAALGALYVLWNAYYVGYEPTFTDLAEPAATDTLMVALWLAGFAEIAAGAPWIGVGALWLSAFILYSAPVLALPALLAYGVSQRRWRPLALWLAALVAAVAAALVYGMLSGDLGDWVRQVKSEYWYDIVDQARRSATLPFAGRLLLLTGALPLLAVFRWRLVSPAARALACAALVYLILTFASSYKNLHYLAPLPFLLAPAALQASGPRARALAAAVIVAAFALSWPSSTAVHRETVEIGERSCVSGLGYEDASLQGDVVYRAFAPTGQAERFAVGKHTFVRYALERGGADCLVRLSPKAPEGWIPLAGDDVVMSTRDPAGYARWRLRSPPVPASWLFPQPGPAPLRAAPDAWPLTIALGARPGSALVIEDFDPRATATARARLLVPVTAQRPSVSVAVRVPHPAAPLEARINGAPPVTAAMTADAAEVDLGGAGWRRGWNVVELVSPGGPLALQAIRVSAGDR